MSRSSWKPSVYQPLSQPTADQLVFHNRSTYISEQRVHYRIYVYNGQRWFLLQVTPERVGFRVGDFAPTRKRPVPKKKNKAKK